MIYKLLILATLSGNGVFPLTSMYFRYVPDFAVATTAHSENVSSVCFCKSKCFVDPSCKAVTAIRDTNETTVCLISTVTAIVMYPYPGASSFWRMSPSLLIISETNPATTAPIFILSSLTSKTSSMNERQVICANESSSVAVLSSADLFTKLQVTITVPDAAWLGVELNSSQSLFQWDSGLSFASSNLGVSLTPNAATQCVALSSSFGIHVTSCARASGLSALPVLCMKP